MLAPWFTRLRRYSRDAAETGLALEGVELMPLEIWKPDACPLCKRGIAIDAVSGG